MGVKVNRFRSSSSTSSDLGQRPIFFAAILVFGMVALVLFFGSSWSIAPTIASSDFGQTVQARTVGLRPPTRVPTTVIATGQPKPALLAAVLQPVPTIAATATETPATTTPPIALTVEAAQPAAPFQLSVGHVGNTNGDGVFLRRSPRLADRWIAWPDHTPLIRLGNEADGDGQHWFQVRDPKANVGWVPAQYVVQ